MKILPVRGLLLEMALQAERLVALVEQPLINRTVRRMATHATFAQRFVLEDKRTALRGMALETSFVLAEQGHAPAFE